MKIFALAVSMASAFTMPFNTNGLAADMRYRYGVEETAPSDPGQNRKQILNQRNLGGVRGDMGPPWGIKILTAVDQLYQKKLRESWFGVFGSSFKSVRSK